MTPVEGALVAGAGLLAGAVNAVAGGGTLLTFPALLAVGVAPVTAAVTSAVGLLPGYAAGSLAYRRELAGQGDRVRQLGAPCVAGAVLGAVLLLTTPQSAFRSVVPWLVLASCGLLAAQPALSRRLAARRPDGGVGAPGGASGAASRRPAGGPAAAAGVALAAVYGSYFGAGLGVLLLAVLGLLLVDDLQRVNALKGLLSLGINAVGVLVFVLSAEVAWVPAAVLAGASAVGGAVGVASARRLPGEAVRWAVVGTGLVVGMVLLR